MGQVSENTALTGVEIDGGIKSVNTSENHITSQTTTTPTSSTAYISSIAITVTAAGTASNITIRDKQGTPVVLVNSLSTTSTNTTPTVVTFDEPVKMTSGIDIVTDGTLAATVNVWITYWQ